MAGSIAVKESSSALAFLMYDAAFRAHLDPDRLSFLHAVRVARPQTTLAAHNGILIGFRFPFRFDPRLLHADLATAREIPWPTHYNERDFGGNWSGIALRSASGSPSDLIGAPPCNPVFRDTPLLERCPYFRQALSVFECPLKSARLLSLAPRSFIREHSDHGLGYEDGEIRIHIPLETNPGVEFYMGGERLLLEEGHSYFVNVNLPHRVNNRGASDRVHLVIDAEVNEWIRALFRRGAAESWSIPRSARPPGNVDDFRRHVLAEPALQRELQAIESLAQFTDAAVQLGRDASFDHGDIDAAIRGGPLPASADEPPAGPEWSPVSVSFRARQPVAEWIWTGPHRFTEPYFEDSIRVAMRHPFAKLFRRELPLAATSQTAPAPRGFIFHVSRCGSTLISQMLAAPASHRSLSEPPPLDDVLQAHLHIPDLTREERVLWLRQIVYAFCVDEKRLFIKLDAWHIHHLPLIREAFPDTPWIFVSREPVEVMVSQLSRPGKIALPGTMNPAILGLQPCDITGFSREQWCAHALASFYRAGLAARHTPGGLFVNYSELPEAVFGSIARHFGISLSAPDLARMREAALRDAKSPDFNFEPDSRCKQEQATPAVRELCESLLSPLYRMLYPLRQ